MAEIDTGLVLAKEPAVGALSGRGVGVEGEFKRHSESNGDHEVAGIGDREGRNTIAADLAGHHLEFHVLAPVPVVVGVHAGEKGVGAASVLDAHEGVVLVETDLERSDGGRTRGRHHPPDEDRQDPVTTAGTAAEGDAVVENGFGDRSREGGGGGPVLVRAEAENTGRNRSGRTIGIGRPLKEPELAADAEVEPPGAEEFVWPAIVEPKKLAADTPGFGTLPKKVPAQAPAKTPPSGVVASPIWAPKAEGMAKAASVVTARNELRRICPPKELKLALTMSKARSGD